MKPEMGLLPRLKLQTIEIRLGQFCMFSRRSKMGGGGRVGRRTKRKTDTDCQRASYRYAIQRQILQERLYITECAGYAQKKMSIAHPCHLCVTTLCPKTSSGGHNCLIYGRRTRKVYSFRLFSLCV